MKNAFLILMTLIAGISLICPSCISDAISTSPSDILTFSRDTVNFDTVFTDLGTPTARLVVSNRAKKGINISSIRLKNPESNFQINVDGVSARQFNDVEIWGKDSIYVFIECFIPEGEGDIPHRVEDELLFVTNGVEQTVLLEAYGQNVTRLRSHRVIGEERLTASRPYVVFDSLVVEKDAMLRIDPGARILFHDGAELRIHGCIEACGEPGKLIQLCGDRLDNVLPDVGYDILAGQWQGIRIMAPSFGNRLEYVDMRSTREGLRIDSCGDLSRDKLLLRNSWLHNSQGSVLESRYAAVDAYGVCFSEASDAVVSLHGGIHRFVQCTIANNYLFSAISSPLVSLYHCLDNEDRDAANPNPLMSASFENCIIYGLAKDLNEGNLDNSQVYFRNVSMKSGGENDEHFIDCLWDCDPLFLTDRPRYYFNYHIQPDSPVIGKGNRAFLNADCAVDIDGVNRIAVSPDGSPSLGAYAQPEEAEDENK